MQRTRQEDNDMMPMKRQKANHGGGVDGDDDDDQFKFMIWCNKTIIEWMKNWHEAAPWRKDNLLFFFFVFMQNWFREGCMSKADWKKSYFEWEKLWCGLTWNRWMDWFVSWKKKKMSN